MIHFDFPTYAVLILAAACILLVVISRLLPETEDVKS